MTPSLEEIGKFIREVGLLGAIVVASIYLAIRYVPRVVASIVTLIDSLRESNERNTEYNSTMKVAVCKLSDSAAESKEVPSLLRHIVSSTERIEVGVGELKQDLKTLQLLPGPTVVQQINQHEPPKEIT